MIVAYNALSLRPAAWGGGATYTLNVLERLPGVLPEARFVVFAREGEDRITPGGAVDVVRVAAASPATRVLAETIRLGAHVRRVGADVLLSPNESLPLRRAAPEIVVAQNLVYHRNDGRAFLGVTRRERATARVQAAYYRRAMRRTYRRADAVIAVSQETARTLRARAGLDDSRTHVVYEGADSALLPPPSGATRSDRLLVVSAFAPYKHLEETVAAFGRVHARRPETRLLIVGSDWHGYRGVVERRIGALGAAADAVEIEHDATPQRLAELYDTSRLLLLLSGCESFGLPLAEAMGRGLPVVAANRSSLPEVAGGAALIVDPAAVNATADAVLSLLDSDAERERLARLGLARAAELTWDACAAGVARVIRGVIEGKP